ncbi:hypothetical protein MZM54_03655 [[Brevibacterium] frigoritolerans]|nr:hypothetical protein [Peribacillus frigoritolerans]
MIIKLKSLREESGGCPTNFTGETTTGQHFEAYLRNGHMKISIGDSKIVSCNPPGLDGVCSFDDFKHYGALNGYIFDSSEAEFSSHYQDMDNLIAELYKDKTWVKFVVDFESKKANLKFEKDKTYALPLDLAEILQVNGLATIDDDNYEKKKLDAKKNTNA